jgi:quinol monooxygenase YgiN
MPVAAVIRFRGDPDEILATYDATRPMQIGMGPTPGLIIHTAARAEDGVVMVDVWESEADYWAFLQLPEVQEAVVNSQLPKPEIELYEIHAMLHPAVGWPDVPTSHE